MNVITKSTFINCSLDELFAFHMNINNIEKITPSNIKIELLDYNKKKYECKIINIRTTKYFISTHWKLRIDTMKRPNKLVDVAVQSPFKSWRHQHVFTQKGSVCELKDIVEYEVGYGLLGRIITPFIESEIRSMFDYRHIETKKILEN